MRLSKSKILFIITLFIFPLILKGLQGKIQANYGIPGLYDLFGTGHYSILNDIYASGGFYGLGGIYGTYSSGSFYGLGNIYGIYGSGGLYGLGGIYGMYGSGSFYGLGNIYGKYGSGGLYGLDRLNVTYSLGSLLLYGLIYEPSNKLSLTFNPSASNCVSLDVNSLDYDLNNVKIFRSSNFFNPRTENAHNIFYSEFDNHYAIRLRQIEVAIANSEDLEGVLSHLNHYKQDFIEFSKYIDNLIIVIAGMPKWLSSSSNDSPIIAGWKEFMAHSPKDYIKWRELICDVVEFFNKPEFNEIMIYYEIGSEPDIGLWREDTESFLKFYKETALAIKTADPESKVGGTAVSSWDGRIMSQFENNNERKELNLELIAYAKEENISLDFISWHHFSVNPNNLLIAKNAYYEAFQANGYDVIPEFIVSEWNLSSEYRNSPYTAALMAETFIGFSKAEISLETFASWEDFDPNLDNLSGFGLMMQNGVKKPIYYVYNFFDKLSRDSQGISVLKKKDHRIIVSKSIKNENYYNILFWDFVQDPQTTAFQYIISKIPWEELIKDYEIKCEEDLERILDQIRMGTSINGKRDKEFAEANSIYNENLKKIDGKEKYVLEFTNFNNIIIHNAKAVKTEIKDSNIQINKNKLIFTLGKNEVLNITMELLNTK